MVVDDKKFLPLNSVNWCSFLTVGWISRLMWRAFRRGLSIEDVYDLSVDDDCKTNAACIAELWYEEKKHHGKPSFKSVIWRFGKSKFILGMFLMVLTSITQFLGPVNEKSFLASTCIAIF